MKSANANRHLALLMLAALFWHAPAGGEPENAITPMASALDFDGIQSYVDISKAATTFGDFTIAGWFKVRNKGSQQFLFRMTNHESSTRRLQITEEEGAITADIRVIRSGSVFSVSSKEFHYNQWFHLAFVRKGDQLALYFDGKRVDASEAAADLLEVNRWAFLGANTYRNSDLRFGHPENYFDGCIDEVQIWTVARDPGQIAASMSEIIGPAKGLHAYWRCNEQRGTRIPDSSAHDFDGQGVHVRWTLPFFEITDMEPKDGAIFADAAGGLRFSIYSGEGNVLPTNIVLVLNGRNQSSGLRISGTQHERYADFRGLSPDQFYRAEIRVTDSRGERIAKAITFNTFRPNEYRRHAMWVGWGIGGTCFLVAFGWVIVVRLGRRRELLALRSRLARDIHDEIGSNLAGIAVLSETAKGSAGTLQEQEEDWGEINRVARQTMESMREVLWLVADTEQIEFDLVKHMVAAARRMLSGKEIQWESMIDQPLPDWRLEDRRQVFLFFKEAITNIVRHAEATRVVLSVRLSLGTFHIQIADNGRGFDPRKVKAGIGMSSQRTRAKSLNGLMQVLTQPGKGTIVRLQVPMRNSRKVWRLETGRLLKPQNPGDPLKTTES